MTSNTHMNQASKFSKVSKVSKAASVGSGSTGKPGRGFAAMDLTRQRQIASQGGKAAHLSGNAHEFTSEEARAAGRKGGQASANTKAS